MAGMGEKPATFPRIVELMQSLRLRDTWVALVGAPAGMGQALESENDEMKFVGTLEDWHKLHRGRVAVVSGLTGRHKIGLHISLNAFCVPESPCDGCRLWARRRVQR